MPCTDSRDYDPKRSKDYRDVVARLNFVTQILCGLCKGLKAEGIDPNIRMSQEGREWLAEHEKTDREREALIERNRRRILGEKV